MMNDDEQLRTDAVGRVHCETETVQGRAAGPQGWLRGNLVLSNTKRRSKRQGISATLPSVECAVSSRVWQASMLQSSLGTTVLSKKLEPSQVLTAGQWLLLCSTGRSHGL